MQKSLFAPLLVLLSLHACAQENIQSYNGLAPKNKLQNCAGRCVPVYLGFSFGINNPAGMLGADVDVPITGHVSVGAGAGVSTWGDKIYLDGKYYLRPCNRGWAFGGGLTYNSGLGDHTYTNSSGTYTHINYTPQVNVFAAAYYYFSIGSKLNRAFVEMGYSEPLTNTRYDDPDDSSPARLRKTVIHFRQPGGIMAGFGYSFAIGRLKH